MIKRKSMVLCDTENLNRKAVLCLEEDQVGLHGTLRLYNFSRDLGGISSLGFYINQKVYKAGLTFKSPMLYEFFLDQNEIPSSFSCAVINFQDAKGKAILYGSSDGNDEVYASIIQELSADTSVANAQSVLDKYEVDFAGDEKKDLEEEIDRQIEDSCGQCDLCEDCVYKKYFFEHAQVETESKTAQEENVTPQPEEETIHQPVFFDKLKPQIDKLFQENEQEGNLQSLIPNSKWIKVDYEDDGDFYVFGLLYDEAGDVRYVCYGVPAVFEEEAPKELSGFPIWVPLDKANDQGFGYWLTYQDAATGEPVKAILE